MIEIPVIDAADQKVSVILDNRRVTIRLIYNRWMNRWNADISIDDVPVVTGRRIVIGRDILAPFNLGLGAIFAARVTADADPGRTELPSGRVRLFHATQAEVEAARATVTIDGDDPGEVVDWIINNPLPNGDFTTGIYRFGETEVVRGFAVAVDYADSSIYFDESGMLQIGAPGDTFRFDQDGNLQMFTETNLVLDLTADNWFMGQQFGDDLLDDLIVSRGGLDLVLSADAYLFTGK